MAAANALRHFFRKFHINLKLTVGNLGKYFLHAEFVGFTVKGKLPFLAGKNAGDVMFINIGAHFKTIQYIYLANALAAGFRFANFGV